MQFPIIYLHIPKTAGTSFRVSAEEYFGEESLLHDYGENSAQTSEEILTGYYQSEDKTALRKFGLTKKFLGGHFSLPRYREVFPDSPIVTFFRDPVNRVVSEYVHFTNHHNYTGTLETFYRSKDFQNRQHRSLGGLKPTDLDYFGMTERYEESLKMFNAQFGTHLKYSVLNTGTTRLQPTESQIEEIKHLNQADIETYQCALESFEIQSSSIKSTLTTANTYRSNLGGIRNEQLCGWIFKSGSLTPIEIVITVNGEHRLTTMANFPRPDLVDAGLHSIGTCGFKIPLQELGSVNEYDSISVKTTDGTYELINSPLVVENTQEQRRA